MQITAVIEEDLADLLPLMRAYCDFYLSTPSDAALLAISRALIADPDAEGVQFLVRTDDGQAAGFATLYWTWATTLGARIAVMNDLFVSPAYRGTGLAQALIAACRDRCHDGAGARLTWQTAPDNFRAQAVYDRVGATREQWVDYWLDTR